MTGFEGTSVHAARGTADGGVGTPVLEVAWALVAPRDQSSATGGEVHLSLSPVDDRHAMLGVTLHRGQSEVRTLLERPVRASCEHRDGWIHVEAAIDERVLVRADVDPRGTVRLVQAPVLYELGFPAGRLEAPAGRLARSMRGAATG